MVKFSVILKFKWIQTRKKVGSGRRRSQIERKWTIVKHEGDINLFFLEFLSSQTYNNNRRMTGVIKSKINRMKEILLKNNGIIINNELMSGHSTVLLLLSNLVLPATRLGHPSLNWFPHWAFSVESGQTSNRIKKDLSKGGCTFL